MVVHHPHLRRKRAGLVLFSAWESTGNNGKEGVYLSNTCLYRAGFIRPKSTEIVPGDLGVSDSVWNG